ncbi:MAG: hypothetical protein AAGJ82_15170 [Bacteroidota bacterium]
MTKWLLSLLLVGFSWTATAQSYDLAAGVRLGTDYGLSILTRVPPIHKNFTLEAIVQSSFTQNEGLVTFLGARHIPILTRRLNVYGGIGPHFGWLERDPNRAEDYRAPMGVSAVGGAEVNFRNLNLSFDFKPTLNLVGGERRFYSQTAFTARFIIFKRHAIYASPREKRQKARRKKRDQRRKNRSGKKWWDRF